MTLKSDTSSSDTPVATITDPANNTQVSSSTQLDNKQFQPSSVFHDIYSKIRLATIGYPITQSITITPVSSTESGVEEEKPKINISLVSSMFSPSEDPKESIKKIVGDQLFDKYDIQKVSIIDPINLLIQSPNFKIDNSTPKPPSSRIPGHTIVKTPYSSTSSKKQSSSRRKHHNSSSAKSDIPIPSSIQKILIHKAPTSFVDIEEEEEEDIL